MSMADDDYRQRSAATRRLQTRTKVLAAAQKLLDERGWHGTRLEDVAKEAGVSIASVHNHFQTKQELVRTIYAPHMGELTIGVLSDLIAQPDQPLLAVERCIGRLAAYAHHDRALTEAYVLMTADLLSKPSDNNRDQNQTEWINLVVGPLTSVLSEAQNLHQLRLEQPADELAFHHGNGLMLRVLRFPEEPPEKTALFVLSQILPVLKVCEDI